MMVLLVVETKKEEEKREGFFPLTSSSRACGTQEWQTQMPLFQFGPSPRIDPF